VKIKGLAVLSENNQITAFERQVLTWLKTGLNNPEGRLSLFDGSGQKIPASIQRFAIQNDLAEGWFANPMRPEWMVCRLTARGQRALSGQRT
jgi:hypothetical protein